ncbi:SMI1/KNR4 family protein [Alkalihalophilus marmarensis]|uniref:SMI1/KNR4 family protein n=1 Tax=Alkalihalophilus marmarensis TaxID=521377 RepID=UPI00398AD8C3
MVELAEEQLTVKLPYSFIKNLKQQNGGYIQFNGHLSDVPISWADDHVNVDYIFGITKAVALIAIAFCI